MLHAPGEGITSDNSYELYIHNLINTPTKKSQLPIRSSKTANSDFGTWTVIHIDRRAYKKTINYA